MPSRRKRFTLELANNPPDFGIKPAHPGRWSKDGLHWLYTEKAAGSEYMTFFKEDVLTGDSAPLYNPEEIYGKELFKKLNFGFHRVSEDESKILFNEKPPTSRPTRSHGNVFLLDIKAKTLRQLTNTERDQRNSKLSPNGKLVGVVRSENIYVIDPAGGKEIQLTDDGSANVYNGRFGWVYEEELGLTDGFLFSPDSKSIAYWQTDESDVPVVNIQRYDDLHMGGTRTRYPKSGDPNPKVRIGVVSVSGGATKWLEVNLPGEAEGWAIADPADASFAKPN